MEKYIKIHWSIQIILGFILFISIFLIAGSIYGGIYHTQIQETLSILGNNMKEKITISTILVSFLIPLLMIITVYHAFNYKRWAIITFFIGIGLPLNTAFLGMIGYITFGLYSYGFESVQGDEVLFFSIYTSIILLAGFSIKTNIELIRLYRNIKNIAQIEESKFQYRKPRFLNLLITSMIPLFVLGGLMIALYSPVIPLDLPEGYFKINGFDLDNPIYTDQKICKEFESEIGKMSEDIRNVTKKDTNSGVILAKNVLFSYPTDGQIMLKYDYSSTEENKQKKNKKISELETYIENYPEQWTEVLTILRSQLANESIIELEKLIKSFPQEVNCSIRNDENIANELNPSLTKYLTVARLYDAAIKLSLLENNRKKAIDLLRSVHEFNVKFFNSNTNLVRGMIGIAILKIEFGSVESIVKESNEEELQRIQEIYISPYDIQKNQINAWKGEYYLLKHILTGRGKSIKQVSIPYLFNGEDMLNRAIILTYAWSIADSQDDTIIKQKIEENQILNNENFLTPTERSFLEKGTLTPTWRGNNVFFGRFYNPIGKLLIEALLPNLTSYQNRYRNTEIYQNYIRYNLLGIEKK